MMSDDLSALIRFNGIARLFPLPNLVLFPLVTQGLHIFEPRYRQMTAEALAGDRLIGMALLRPGWESNFEGRPVVYPVACLGRVVAEHRLHDGRYDLQLRGLSRARIRQEIDNGKPYRSARVELLCDTATPDEETEASFRRQLIELLPQRGLLQWAAVQALRKLLGSPMPLGAVGDVISYALPLPIEFKQELLEDQEVEQRVRKLIRYLETSKPSAATGPADKTFPPDFSGN